MMHQTIVKGNAEDYLESDPQLRTFFERLNQAGKKLFLVTNSPFIFVWVSQPLVFFLLFESCFHYF